jgi:aryl-alcohol dehydrogenase-like predicted oxidoreductase
MRILVGFAVAQLLRAGIMAVFQVVRKSNQPVVDLLRDIARRKHSTPAQIVLAWLLAQKPWIVPILGTTKLEHLNEIIGALSVELTSYDLSEIDNAISKITVQGTRLPEEHMKLIDR